MSISVELFGIPRERAGVARTEVYAASLGEVLIDLARRYPRLDQECIAAGRLQSGYMANLNGQKFITDPQTRLAPGDALLILSTDAGG